MEANKQSLNSTRILWLQVAGLASVQGAITLSWLIYALYLPQLLVEFGFPASLAAGLLILENALAVVMEPLFGGLSDRFKRKLGTSFPFISLGVILSSALFIAIPAFVTLTEPNVITRSLLPIIAVAWALAMTVFRSPAIALLGRYASREELPLAASLLTLTGGVISAFRGIANKFILGLGPVFTFSVGSFVLLMAAAALRYVNPPEIPTDTHHAEESTLPRWDLALICGTGVGIAWGSRFLMDAWGKLLKIEFNADNIDYIMLWLGILLAFAAYPAGIFATKIGNRKAMLLGIGTTILGMGILLYIGANIATVLIIVAGFSIILNGAIPFALDLMPRKWSGLGIGMYFSGFAGGMSLFGLMFPQLQEMTPLVELVGGTIAFLFAGVCVFIGKSQISEQI